MDSDGTEIGCGLAVGPALAGSAALESYGFPVRVHNLQHQQYHKVSLVR